MASQSIGPTPAEFDFKVWAGSDTHAQTLKFMVGQTPIDISAYGAVLTIASPWGVVLARTVGNGLTIVDGPNGVLQIDPFTPAETRSLESAKYELEMRLPNGTQETWLYGKLIVDGDGINDD